MILMEPILFTPLYIPRVWGGRQLETFYQRSLPDAVTPFGESWELVDRENEQSIVTMGHWKDWSLHQLWNEKRNEIFGDRYSNYPARFPILIKILDTQQKLSIQVHPPENVCEDLGGEPKSEMWHITHCHQDSKIYFGLKNQVTREAFENAVKNGNLAELIHQLSPSSGDFIYIPSGRIHAIGAGFLIHEIQQNSDTTYRVFDWGRLGLDGVPRTLHVEESLRCIDFEDFEPNINSGEDKILCPNGYFFTEKILVSAGEKIQSLDPNEFCLLLIVSGQMHDKKCTLYKAGQTLLLPKNASALIAAQDSLVLRVTLP